MVEGVSDGSSEGLSDGCGLALGLLLGSSLGSFDGEKEEDGARLGTSEGDVEGWLLGASQQLPGVWHSLSPTDDTIQMQQKGHWGDTMRCGRKCRVV